ncbi:MAG: hypothetical protein AB8F26_00410 [Phycisphaerales bacterium]
MPRFKTKMPDVALTGIAMMATVGLPLVGCQSSSKVKRPQAQKQVGAEAFALTASDQPVGEPDPIAVFDSNPATDNPIDDEGIVVRSTRPVQGNRPEPAAPEGLALIEAKVGDINGKPIYLSSFFEPIEARLSAEADRLRLAGWRNTALAIIRERLDGVIMDELLRAEALAALSEGQRQGLRSFLTNFRKDALSKNLGSAQLASRRGQDLDDAMREKEIETLVGLTLFQEVNKRVNVSWRDIQQRYDRDIEKYNPPPTAVFRLLRLVTEDQPVIEMGSRIARGEEFEVLASESSNTHRAADGGLHRAEYDGPYEDAEFFGSDTLNEKARTLRPGQIAGPFELGRFTCWLKLESIEQETTSLYDAQLAINYELTQERRTETRTEYFNRLFERARVSNRDAMLIELLQIAEERYGPE